MEGVPLRLRGGGLAVQSLEIEGSILLFTSSGLRLQVLHVPQNSGLLLT